MHYCKSEWMRITGVQNHYFEAVSFNEKSGIHWYQLLKTGKILKPLLDVLSARLTRFPKASRHLRWSPPFYLNSDITNHVFKGNWVALQHPDVTVLGCDTTYSTSETPASLSHTATSHLNKASGQVNSLTFIVHLTTCSTDKFKLIHVFFKCVMAL